ncbi:MAG TPA: oligosaccharide flippase family protein [Candidatus Kapabacteria bacterium]|nr:oligosaccharide flippase family protein [Candidatus Kapabacteria bacterium]
MPESQSVQSPSSGRTKSPLVLAIWAAADKVLPMIYGIAVIIIPLRILSPEEWGAWTIFQVVFMVIVLVGDFFVLQPMVKIAAEGKEDPRPVITAAFLLYAAFTLVLGLIVTLGRGLFAPLLKSPLVAESFLLMTLLVLTNVVRTVAIRVLQISYRIVAIFFVDLVYFAILVALMVLGEIDGTFRTSVTFVNYNVIAFTASSVLGVIVCGRLLRPTFRNFMPSLRRLLDLGIHQGGTGMLTVLQQQSDVIIVSGLKGSVAAGLYNAARTFYRFFDSVRDAVQLLLVPATSRAYSQKRIEAVEEVTELATAAVAALMIPLTIVMIALAPWIVPFVLHKPDAVEEFQLLMAGGFAMPFVIVPSAVLLGIGHTRDLYRGTLIGTAVLILGGLVLTWFMGTEGMATAVLLGTTVTAVLLTQRMNRYVPFTIRSVLRRSRSFGPLVRGRIAQFSLSLRKTPSRGGGEGNA